jgi:DNA-binding CsgD family transcriptional regulator
VFFAASLLPMLVVDDDRRYLDANRAACLLLRSSRERVLQLRIDDLTPLEGRHAVDQLWELFLRDGSQAGTFELLMPDGARLHVEYSATANVEPGRHLWVLSFPTSEHHEGNKIAPVDHVLTPREREILTLVAMGERSAGIGHALGISPATVETHLRRCMTKLDAKNRTHAVTLGVQRHEIVLQLRPRPA